MIATRIRCTESDLQAAFRVLGFVAPTGEADVASASASLRGSDLVDDRGVLTAEVEAILPLIAEPQRIITVSSVGPGDVTANSASIVAPDSGGPFVFRGDHDGEVDIVAVESPTAATALLDEILMLTALPTSGPFHEAAVDAETWLGLLAATDTVEAKRLEAQLAREFEPTPTIDAEGIQAAMDHARRSGDARWILGAMAAVHPAVLDTESADSEALLAKLAAGGFVASEGPCKLTEAGMTWIDALGSAVRVSHTRILQVVDGAPVDIAGVTSIRSPLAIVVARAGVSDVTLTNAHPDVALAMFRAMLIGAGDAVPTGSRSADRIVAAQSSGVPATGEIVRSEWVYVLDPVDVWGLHDTGVVVGSLQPGTWYLLVSEEGAWVRVADPDGRLEGWASAAQVHRRSDPVEVETTREPEPTPVRVETEPAWAATHTVPTEGLQAWAEPDPAGQMIATLAGGVELQVTERRADWAHVRAENGWEAWVDGRGLASASSGPMVPDSTLQPTVARGVTLQGLIDPNTLPGTLLDKKFELSAVVAMLISAFLPWAGSGGNAFDFPFTFLLTADDSWGGPSLGVVLLVVAAAAIGTVVVRDMERYQLIAGGVAAGLAALFLVQLLRLLIDFFTFTAAVGSLFTESFGLGPWLLLAGGIVLIVRR